MGLTDYAKKLIDQSEERRLKEKEKEWERVFGKFKRNYEEKIRRLKAGESVPIVQKTKSENIPLIPMKPLPPPKPKETEKLADLLAFANCDIKLQKERA